MDGYLSKPIDPLLLFDVVEQGGGDGARVQTPVPASITFDEAALRVRLSGDLELVAEVILAFLDDPPMRLAEIEAAVTDRNPGALREASHTGLLLSLRPATAMDTTRSEYSAVTELCGGI
jgi:hypothetical protein